MKFEKVLKETTAQGATTAVDVQGLPKPLKDKNGKDRIIRRKIKNPVVNIGNIKI